MLQSPEYAYTMDPAATRKFIRTRWWRIMNRRLNGLFERDFSAMFARKYGGLIGG
jgi:hypothetical protein